MAKEEWYDKLACALVFIGALNWGLIAAFNFDLVNAIIGGMPQVMQVVYILVGVSAIYMAYGKYVKK